MFAERTSRSNWITMRPAGEMIRKAGTEVSHGRSNAAVREGTRSRKAGRREKVEDSWNVTSGNRVELL